MLFQFQAAFGRLEFTLKFDNFTLNMIQKCNFDKVRDIQEHVPSLATDLNKAIETNTVQDTGVVADFNSIEEPSAITGRVSDAFEAIDAQRAILAAGKAAKAKADAAAAASAAAAAAAAAGNSVSSQKDDVL